MRRWLGASAVAVALGAGAWACDGDTTPAKQFDSGADATTDAPADAPADSTVDAGPTRAKMLAIHASPDLPAVRVCFGMGLQNDGSDAVVASVLPVPDKALTGQPYPGLFPGAGAALPDFGIDLSQKALTPYLIVASKLAASTQSCDALLAPNAGTLTPGVDYFKMPTLKNGTFASDTTIALVVTGCLPQAADPSASAVLCGGDYGTSAGNLAVQLFSLDRAVKGAFGAQFLQASSAAAGKFALAYGTGDLTAELHPLDGGAGQPIATGVKYGELQPGTAAALVAPDVNQTSLLVTVPGDGGAAFSSSFPLPLVYEVTTGQPTGAAAYFASGANYTFVLVGDPAQPTLLDGGAFNGYSLHALAFPNSPPLPAP